MAVMWPLWDPRVAMFLFFVWGGCVWVKTTSFANMGGAESESCWNPFASLAGQRVQVDLSDLSGGRSIHLIL